jgi:hypothetical protein
MKKYLFLIILSIGFFCTNSTAQKNAASKTSTPTKAFALAKNASAKTKAFVTTTNEQDSKCYAVFLEYYKATTQLQPTKDENGNEVPVPKESIDKLKVIRNEKLQKILTPDQFKIWYSVLEPILIKDESN